MKAFLLLFLDAAGSEKPVWGYRRVLDIGSVYPVFRQAEMGLRSLLRPTGDAVYRSS